MYRRLALVLLSLSSVGGCSERRPKQGPLSARQVMQAQIVPSVEAQHPPVRTAPARPDVSIFYVAGLRGRVTATLVPPTPGAPLRNPGLPPITEGGLARRAAVVDRARVDAKAVVQVDAGDFLPLPSDTPRDAAAPTPRDFARWTGLVLQGFHRLGVDAVTLGARELTTPQGLRKLVDALDKAHVPVVLANLVDEKGAAVVPADKLVDAKGLSVGIFGVTELPPAQAAALKKAGFALTDPAKAAEAAAASLRARGAKVVVALVNAGLDRAPEIAAGARADLVVVGPGARSAPAAGPLPRNLAVPGDAFATVDRFDVQLAADGAPTFNPRGVALASDVPEQVGVDELSRVLTTTMFDSEKLRARAAKGKKNLSPQALRDLYEAWDYGSTKACGFCHEKQVAQWQTTDHAHAFATLTKAKRDQDRACLGCHVMGFLTPGGTRDIILARTQFADVGCEACHGGSAEHVRSPDKKQGTKRKVDPIVCFGCHTPDWSEGFDPVASMKEILGPGHGMP